MRVLTPSESCPLPHHLPLTLQPQVRKDMILDIVRQHSQLSGNATMEEFGMRLELDADTGFMRVSDAHSRPARCWQWNGSVMIMMMMMPSAFRFISQLPARLLPLPTIEFAGGEAVSPQPGGDWKVDSRKHKLYRYGPKGLRFRVAYKGFSWRPEAGSK